MKHVKVVVVIGLVVVAAWTRLWRLEQPVTYYFDEVYHAFTAKYYAQNDPKGYEWWHQSPEKGTAFEWLHPPLAKLLQAGSMWLLGVGSWQWRLPSAVFGLGVVALVYWWAGILGLKWWWRVVASGLAVVDGLLLTMSRIAMNDIFVTFWMLVSLGGYWQWRGRELGEKWWGVMVIGAGLACATKWSGVFVVLIVGLWEGVRLVKKVVDGWKKEQKMLVKEVVEVGLRMAGLVVGCGVIYVVSYGQFWLQGHSVDQFIELHRQIWHYQTTLTATHPYQSRPLEWVLAIKPVWMHVDYRESGLVGNIYAWQNPLIAWLGGVAMIGLAVIGVGRRKEAWLYVVSCYLLVWVEWFLSPRIMFYYHYTPAVPFLCLALAIVTEKMWRVKVAGMKGLVVGGLGLMVMMFGWVFPYYTAVPVAPERTEMISKWHTAPGWISSWVSKW